MSLEVIHEIINESWTHWIAEDGLMSLTRGEFRDPYPGEDLKTVTNDNGILFSTIFYILCRRVFGPDVVTNERWRQAVERLEVERGLYNRNPGRDTPEAHDNPGAIACGALLFSAPPFSHRFARDICDYGNENGWDFSNNAPGSFMFKQLRQGGEIATLKILGGEKPYVLEWVWFLIGTLLGVFKITKDASATQLKWMRHEALCEAFKRLDWGVSWLWLPLSFYTVLAIFNARLYLAGGMRRVFESYYTARNPEHPIVLLAQALNI